MKAILVLILCLFSTLLQAQFYSNSNESITSMRINLGFQNNFSAEEYARLQIPHNVPVLALGVAYLRPETYGYELGLKFSEHTKTVTNKIYTHSSTTPARARLTELGIHSGLVKQLYQNKRIRILASVGLVFSKVSVNLRENSYQVSDSDNAFGLYVSNTWLFNIASTFNMSLRTELRYSTHKLDTLGIDKPRYDGAILLGFHIAPHFVQKWINAD